MNRLFRLALFLMFLTSIAVAQPSFEIPAQIKRNLDRQYPGWRWAQHDAMVKSFFETDFAGASPFAINGDFDGDGKTDYALLIEHTNFNEPGKAFSHVVETLAFLKRGKSYKLYILTDPSPASPEYYLTLARKHTEQRELGKRHFRHKNDAIETSYFEKAGGVYIWKNGKFRYLLTSD